MYIILDDYSFLCMPTNTVLKIVDDRGDANYTPHTHLQLVKEHYHAHIKDFDFYSELCKEAKSLLGIPDRFPKRPPFQILSPPRPGVKGDAGKFVLFWLDKGGFELYRALATQNGLTGLLAMLQM